MPHFPSLESCEYLFVVAVPFVRPVKLFHVLNMKILNLFFNVMGEKSKMALNKVCQDAFFVFYRKYLMSEVNNLII